MASDQDLSGRSAGGLSRRELMQRSLGVGAALTVPGLLAACGSSSSTSTASAAAAAGKPRKGGELIVAFNDGAERHALALEHADL